MKPKRIENPPQEDLFRSRLDNIINLRHELVKLASSINWDFLESKVTPFYATEGRPGTPIRLMAGLHILKHMYNLSDEGVCERWVENPYFQYFCGETYFQHKFPIERSSMTHFRDRVGEDFCIALLQESLNTAHQLGALETKQMKRAKKVEKKLKTYLGRMIRDVERKIAGEDALRLIFKAALKKAAQIYTQQKTDTDKIYAWHAPEVECIAKGKAHKPYEFGCKVSITTNVNPAPAGHFVLHAKAFHGRPYDGHTLTPVLEEMGVQTGIEFKRAYVDKGYRGHQHPKKHHVFMSGQKRGLTATIKRELRRRSAVEPLIGHLKNEGRLGRNYLSGVAGDKINAIMVSAGYNFKLILRWLRFLFSFIFADLISYLKPRLAQKQNVFS